MAPVPETLLNLLTRSLLPSATPTINDDPGSLSPMGVHDAHLAKRVAATAINPASGSRPPNEFNNKGFQALFALLGMGMVVGSLWFFFWAKNGGLKWQQNDWEDYKSTVLRRKGPDGKTLSNATKSTKLGGGSVVHGGSYGRGDFESSVGFTDETGTTISEMREKDGGHGHGLRGGEGRKKHRKERPNNNHDPELRDYRHEKAARVGGMNRDADGVYVDYSNTEPSILGSDLSQRPLTGPKDGKDKKKIDKEKKKRAVARMKEAQRKEKEDKKNAAAEAKAAKEAEKANKAKAKKEEKAQGKKKQSAPTEISEPAPSVAPTAPSEFIPAPPKATKSSRRAPPSGAYSFVTGEDTATVYTGLYTQTAPSEHNESSYYSDYRPHAEPSAFNQGTRSQNSTPGRRERERRSESRSRQSSPRKHHRPSRPAQSDIFSNGETEETGTKVYPCHIPGLSQSRAGPGSIAPGESISQVGVPTNARRGRDVMSGYRRGGNGRRDSLSDSDS